MQLTEEQRRVLLERAVDAVRARYDVTPDTPQDEVTRLSELATLAVTDAVTRGGHLHTIISTYAGVTGLAVISLIADVDAAGKALRYERNAAKNYQERVRRECAAYAQRRIGVEGPRARGMVAKLVGVTGPTVDAWVAEGEQEQAQQESLL